MRATLMVLALVVAGCAGCGGHAIMGDGSFVVIDYDQDFEQNTLPDGTPEDVPLRAGIYVWNHLGANLHTPAEAALDPRGATAPHYRVVRDTFTFPGVGDSSKPLGYCWPGLDHSTIYVGVMKQQNVYSYESIREDVAHELGHALGLQHVDAAQAIMTADVSYLGSRPTTADEAEYARVYPKN